MINLKRIGLGLFALILAVSVSMLGQMYINTNAANTLPGNNETITIDYTVDGQQIGLPIVPVDYSHDGNVILFVSGSGYGGLYVHNIKTDATTRVDVSTNGVNANGTTFNASYVRPVMSETGRYVTFSSMATNLIDGTTKPSRMIYKRDTQTNETTLVGAGYTGGYSDKWDRNLAVSNDGRFALVSSRYLDNGYPNNYGIALGDGTTGTYSWNRIGSGSDSYDDATAGGMSCDGAFAVFKDQYSIILADLRGGSLTTLTAGNSTSTSPMISCNGRYVLYATKNRTDITPTPSGMDSYLHLVRYDRITGERIYIDSDSSGIFSTSQIQYNPTYSDQQPNVFNASIADTGDVVFRYNGYTYLKHLSDGSGTLEPIAKTASGTYIDVDHGTITSDGRYIFFMADPYDLGLAPSPSGSQLIRTKTDI